MVVRTTRSTGGIPAPAITVVARQSTPTTLLGWKDLNGSDWSQASKRNQTTEEFIEEHTFKRHDAIKDVLWGYDSKSIMSNNLVHEDYTMTWQGKFFFVNVSRTMTPTQNARLSLALSHSFVFQIFIHDPDFFEINYQPTFPAILKTIKPTMEFNQYHSLLLTEVCLHVWCTYVRLPQIQTLLFKQVHDLNLPNNPCNSESSYNFRSCLKVGFCESLWSWWVGLFQPGT